MVKWLVICILLASCAGNNTKKVTGVLTGKWGEGVQYPPIPDSVKWRQISGPVKSVVLFDNRYKATATFYVKGVYQFEFRVYPYTSKDCADTMKITVN